MPTRVSLVLKSQMVARPVERTMRPTDSIHRVIHAETAPADLDDRIAVATHIGDIERKNTSLRTYLGLLVEQIEKRQISSTTVAEAKSQLTA